MRPGGIPVFVVGTLKRGFALHERGLTGARFLGAYRTLLPFVMVIAGPWFAPMLIAQSPGGRRLTGELYAVDASRLAQLDALESVGQPGNERVLVSVAPVGGGVALRAHVYVKAPELAIPVHSGPLDDYQDNRFVPPEERPEVERAPAPSL